jgi:hypothetical protein
VNPEASVALTACGAIVAVSVVISSLETVLSWRDYATGGLFDGRIVSERRLLARSRVARVLAGWLFNAQAVWALALLRVICGIVLLAPGVPMRVRGVSAAGAFLAGGLMFFRRRYGGDGSDDMTQVVLGGVAIGLLATSSRLITTVAVIFIASQGCLAYFASGFAKLISALWRSGVAPAQIANTATFGNRTAARWLARHPGASRLCAWVVIAGECAFPLVLVAPPWLMVVILAWTIAFHLGCAVMMGFNTFFWSFVATYPAILYARSLILAGH